MYEQWQIEEVKKQINNMLWMMLPGEVKLKNAEVCAIEMLDAYKKCFNSVPKFKDRCESASSVKSVDGVI